ncbi:2'-5' RNA ligase family protein [Deinococcus frigens]|uniref:2'-5' RNA ligase family protein n=1 Tax=Deinococcus frigens TaxID=249403 RepID=UPI000552099F|nr:hypothetical protein [Deinococcus frigens]
MNALPVQAPDFEAVQAGYDRMWATGQPEIARNGVVADPVPDADAGSTRWGISVIAGFDADFASSLLALVDEVRPLCGENHTFYDASNLHTTIRACEFYRAEVGEHGARVGVYRDLLGQLCRRSGPFEVTYAGLNGNHTGIIAQGYAMGGLREFRRELHRQLAEKGLHHGPEAEEVRRTTHSSLVVFGGPLGQSGAVSDWLAERRTLSTGSARLSRLSLVRYRRSQSGVECIPLAGFDLMR